MSETTNNKKEITKRSNLDLDFTSIEVYQKLEDLVDKLENSTIASQFKEDVYDKDKDGNPIESTKKVTFNKADMVMCLALGIELGMTPMVALSYGKQLNIKSIVKIEKGKKLGLDYATSLEGIHLWQAGGKDIVYTSIGIVNAVLTKVGVKKEIIHNGSSEIIDYISFIDNSISTVYKDNYKIVPNNTPESMLEAVIKGLQDKDFIPVKKRTYFKAEIKLTRYNTLRKEDEIISIPYTSLEAISAGLLKGVKEDGTSVDGKDNWNNHLAALLRKMSIMNGARIIAGDILGGIYLPEEIPTIKYKESNNDNIEEAEIVEEN